MPSFRQLMDHERHRWSYMSPNRLLQRLGRIWHPLKLECFLTLAVEREAVPLQQAVIDRANTLHIALPSHLLNRVGTAVRSSLSTTSSSEPTTSQRSTPSMGGLVSRGGRVWRETVQGAPNIQPKKKLKKKKPVRHIRFNKGDS